MADQRIFGFNLFALALVLFLCIKVNSSQWVNYNERLASALRREGQQESAEQVEKALRIYENELQLLRNRRGLGTVIAKAFGNLGKAGGKSTRKGTLPNGQKYHTAPKKEDMTGFPDLEKVKSKGDRKRWKDNNGDIFEWDSEKGELERYDRRGKHKGAFDPYTGERRGPAKPERRIEI